jgi:hypothetical protein
MATYDHNELFIVFDRFASFGAGAKTGVTASFENINGPLLDNAKFAKLCRETKVIDGKNITSTDIDIVYNKVKPKGSRKITFENFVEILNELGPKRFPKREPEHAFHALVELIVNNGTPVSNGTVAEANGVFAKLTDVSTYTGSHKERFNEDGTGRGLEGRETTKSTDQLSKIVNRSSKRPANVVSVSSETLDKVAPKKSDIRSSTDKLGSRANVSKSTSSLSKSTTSLKASNSSLNASKNSLTSKNYAATQGSGSVFDRLTNTKDYTGTHKHRFDENGNGMGLAGRDTVANVKNLAQILRN